MSDNQCAQVPLRELLRSIPIDQAVDIQEKYSSQHIPVGRYAHEAADEITRLTAKIAEAEQIERSLSEQLRVLDAKCAEYEAKEQLHADAVDTTGKQSPIAQQELHNLLAAAYLAGFSVSTDGYNADFPFHGFSDPPEKNLAWCIVRDSKINKLIKE